MATFIPVSGSFNHYASRFVDPALGFTVGWNYWFSWAVTLPSELVAAGIIMQFWLPDVPSWVWFLVILSLLFLINLIGVRSYGEAEYWLSLTKVIAVVVFVFMGILIAAGAIGNGGAIGFSNWRVDGAPFVDGFVGLFAVFTSAFYAYGGTEIVGITAGEASNPRKSVPKAINGTFWRIAIFYICSVFIIGLLLPYNDDKLNDPANQYSTASPFTIGFERAGISAAAHIINAVILGAMISAGNSGMYAASRTIMAMAHEGQAPAIFGRTTSWGVPLAGLILVTLFGGISFLGSVFGNGVVFNWLINISGLASLLTWMAISVSHIRFRKALVAQGYSLDDLPYKAPFYPFGPIISLFLGFALLLAQGIYMGAVKKPFDPVNIVSVYSGLPLYILLFVVYKLVYKTRMVPLEEVDLRTGHVSLLDHGREVEDDVEMAPVKGGKVGLMLRKVAARLA
ncbi:hypothetical protein HK104_006186 [Borealophlyctis nickersoniae]|nr:hypothetical protein HK104_006186 [Borealophlyctis nickersoniae]